MNKSQLMKIVAKRSNLSESVCEKVVNNLKTCVLESCMKGEAVVIKGVGKFFLKEKNPRRLINPQTKRFYLTTPKKVVVFKMSKSFSECEN